jgi:hypothetical protein
VQKTSFSTPTSFIIHYLVGEFASGFWRIRPRSWIYGHLEFPAHLCLAPASQFGSFAAHFGRLSLSASDLCVVSWQKASVDLIGRTVTVSISMIR